jgi:hypothetical protein
MRACLAVVLGALLCGPARPEAPTWKAGVAVQVITPAGPMWAAGYASRNKPSEGKEHDLYVKALALEGPAGNRAVVLTADLIGIPRSLAEPVAALVKKKTGLPRERLMLTISHTHCGPVIADNLADMYLMPPEEARKVGPYTEKLRGWMVDVIVKALDRLAPAQLEVGKGTARFAVNRRKPTEKGVINAANPGGPVDHDVPVLAVRAKGKLLAVVFGYACHNTTMQYYRWSGDYAGFAQADLEEKHPGATALFWAGCGGDANPLPRSKIELCQKYGKDLATAVDDVLAGKMTPVTGRLATRFATVALPLAALPGKQQWAADMLSKNHALRARAKKMLATLEKGGKIDDHYRHYPVQAWALGDQVTWVALGGEVVVDYSLRLKKELAGKRAVWVAGYANDVMAYIPSARVLKEGGYEADSSMIYYGLPAKWAPAVEEKIVARVHELVKDLK